MDRERRPRRNPYVFISGVFGGAWVFTAWLRPEANYVLFPVLVAGSVPVIYRLTFRRALPMQAAVATAVAGLINVVVLAAFLSIAGKLQGPTVLPQGGRVLDAAVFGLLGAVIGVVAATLQLRREP